VFYVEELYNSPDMVDTNTLTVYTTDDLNRVCFHNNNQKHVVPVLLPWNDLIKCQQDAKSFTVEHNTKTLHQNRYMELLYSMLQFNGCLQFVNIPRIQEFN